MSIEPDPIMILEKLRPATVTETTWPPAARAAVYERVLQAAAQGPQRPEVSRRMRWRLLIAAALAAVLVPTGVGVAAAGGLLPPSFTRALSWWTSETHGEVDAQTTHRVAQGPGPDGDVLSVWTATGKNGTTCVSTLFEPPGALDRPAPRNFQVTAGECPTAEQKVHTAFGDVGGGADAQGIHTMSGPLGDAVRADLLLSDGTVRPAVTADGQFFCWYLANSTVTAPVLVAYDRAGHIVGQLPLPNTHTHTH